MLKWNVFIVKRRGSYILVHRRRFLLLPGAILLAVTMPAAVAGLSAETAVVAPAVIPASVIVLIALPPLGFPPLRSMAAMTAGCPLP